jgi:hypothetical protein
MSFDPYNCFMKIQESIETLIPKVKIHLGMWGFISSHFLTFPGAWNVTFKFHSWLAPSQALALVTSLRLGLWLLGCIFFSFIVSLVWHGSEGWVQGDGTQYSKCFGCPFQLGNAMNECDECILTPSHIRLSSRSFMWQKASCFYSSFLSIFF